MCTLTLGDNRRLNDEDDADDGDATIFNAVMTGVCVVDDVAVVELVRGEPDRGDDDSGGVDASAELDVETRGDDGRGEIRCGVVDNANRSADALKNYFKFDEKKTHRNKCLPERGDDGAATAAAAADDADVARDADVSNRGDAGAAVVDDDDDGDGDGVFC